MPRATFVTRAGSFFSCAFAKTHRRSRRAMPSPSARSSARRRSFGIASPPIRTRFVPASSPRAQSAADFAALRSGARCRDEGQRFCRRQHVDAAADQHLRLAPAWDQRHRGFELRREMGEISERGVVSAVAIDDGAAGVFVVAPQRGAAGVIVLARDLPRVPIAGTDQQCGMHGLHCGDIRSRQSAISASVACWRVSACAPCGVRIAGSPHSR